MDNEISVDLLCQFCNQPLRGEQGRTYRSGDKVTCDACGGENDYDTVIEAAQKAVAEMVREKMGDQTNITFDKSPEK
jgi:hypothetical protein